MVLFRLFVAVDIAVALVVIYFFIVGLGDGSVSSFNIGLWGTILTGIAAVLGGGWWLRSNGRTGAAIALLAVLAVPGLLFGLFVLSLLVTQPRWN